MKTLSLVTLFTLLCGGVSLVSADCYPPPDGRKYKGDVSTTQSGKQCQPWSSQEPHQHEYKQEAKAFPDSNLDLAGAKCRNPSQWEGGVWCYTMDPETEWERCDVPACEADCTQFPDDTSKYTGYVSYTKSGLRCQEWSSQCPHEHTYNKDYMFPDETVSDASNYCRNPNDRRVGLWCYTMSLHEEWEICDVRNCDCNPTPDGSQYKGKTQYTENGRKCQEWKSQSPHEHGYGEDATLFPDNKIADAKNFCRNPDGWADGLWCYTTDPDTRWELCYVPLCE